MFESGMLVLAKILGAGGALPISYGSGIAFRGLAPAQLHSRTDWVYSATLVRRPGVVPEL